MKHFKTVIKITLGKQLIIDHLLMKEGINLTNIRPQVWKSNYIHPEGERYLKIVKNVRL